MIKQHQSDRSDLQLLLDALTETEKQLVVRVSEGLAEDACKITQEKERSLSSSGSTLGP